MNDKISSNFNSKVLRKRVLDMAYAGNTVHIGCAFSIIEVLAVLYRNCLRYPDNDPASLNRDYLVLSKGHGVMAQYACIYEKGWINSNDLKNYFADGSRLKGLSDSSVPGLEVTSGSLGHGFSIGVGLALASSLKKSSQKVYVIVGDGELNEGPIWEGALFAAHHKLDNFMVVVDENKFQAMGSTDEVLNLGNLENKFSSFGFETITIDGHDESAIHDTIEKLWMSTSPIPKAIIAKTTKGKGVSFMENNNIWHYTRLDENTYKKAISEIEDGA
ncbi:transketolase [Chromobacterium haemolyticum]|uniref:transketolase n=1 Tax=Chromobacterium haemolyticum TaxID=394935 RepID=UPI0002E6D491|nr:transketolase [Chromobacterium haemolyticum]